MPNEHHQWLKDLNDSIVESYERARYMAKYRAKVQKLGHRVESDWVQVLTNWLPRQYEVRTRKYILLEDDGGGGTTNETDIVVFHPAYPLRAKDEVLAGGVAAAFSVKRTVGKKAITEACRAAKELHRGMKKRGQTVREEIVPPIVYGLLGQSHVWKGPRSTPAQNVANAMRSFDETNLQGPREGLDLICIADLDCWSRTRTVGGMIWQGDRWVPGPAVARTSMYQQTAGVNDDEPDIRLSPLIFFIASLWRKLALNDPALKPIADGLGVTSFTNTGQGWPVSWPLAEVLSASTLKRVEAHVMQGNDWQNIFP